MSKLLIYNARIVDHLTAHIGYVLIDGPMIARVGYGEPPAEITDMADSDTLDLNGRYLIPGLIDTHVHFREPGMTSKADIATESRAALAGGITSFIDMPNTRPATTTLAQWQWKMERAATTSAANYAFFIGATNNNMDLLRHLDYSRVAGVKLFMGSSTGGMLVDDDNTITTLFSQVPALIAVHAEDEETIRRDTAAVMEATAGNPDTGSHPLIRSTQACVKATRRALTLARATGTRLHLCHISTAHEADLLRQMKQPGITAETAPHYLHFTADDYPSRGNRIKCNPAIKGPSHRPELLKALADGTIDSVATDHAPHLLSEKQQPYISAPGGMPGVQHSLAVTIEALVDSGICGDTDPVALAVEKMAHNPATIFAIRQRGFIREGYYADLAVVEHIPGGYTVLDDNAAGRCRWTPYAGDTFHYRVTATYVNGDPHPSPSAAMPLTFDHTQHTTPI